MREVGIAAIVVESVSRVFLRNNIARALPIFMAPGVTGIVDDGDTLHIDYQSAIVRNPMTGQQVALRRFPPLIEQIFSAGGLPEFAFQRYQRGQCQVPTGG